MLSSVIAGLAICCDKNQRCTLVLLITGMLIWAAVIADCYAEEAWMWNREEEANSPASGRMLNITEISQGADILILC